MKRNVLRWALLPVLVVLGAAAGCTARGTGAAGDSTAVTAHDHAATARAGTPTHDMAGMSDEEMAGMDMGAAPSAAATHDMAGTPGSPAAGHVHGTPGHSVTTRTVVVAAFAVLNAAILVAAAVTRHRTRRTPGSPAPAAPAA